MPTPEHTDSMSQHDPKQIDINPIPSSSPAFNAPVHPVHIRKVSESLKPSILPIQLSPTILRPLAFRIFTKKHNLTLNSLALQSLSKFIGTHCGSSWREQGLAERILDDVAKIWKKNGGGVIVAGEGKELQHILHGIEASVAEIRSSQLLNANGRRSFALGFRDESAGIKSTSASSNGEQNRSNHEIFSLEAESNQDPEDNEATDPRAFLQIISAFEQPRLEYNWIQKHFQAVGSPASVLPDPSRRTHLFHHRFNVIHQRLLRNESFQTSSVPSRPSSLHRSSSAMVSVQGAYKLTPIVNLLGRSGTNHLLLGLLIISPAGTLALCDLTGSIVLDLKHAKPIPEGGAWFTPGMIVLVDGMYEEEGSAVGPLVGHDGGIGGTIGGKFIGFSVGGPPCERRDVTLGVSNGLGEIGLSTSAGFGWVDFLGVGSERATGSRMRRLEQRILRRSTAQASIEGRGRVIILGEVDLTNANTLQAIRKILREYATEPSDHSPMLFVFMGNFVRYAVMAGGGSGGSIEYKEYFDSLASVLSDYPTVLQKATFIFIPGDNDPWASTFSAGAAAALPRAPIPDIFTTRVKRAFTNANAESDESAGWRAGGEAIWSTNPMRIALFGPVQEVVFFRDDLTGRLRRNALKFESLDEEPISSSQADENQSAIAGNSTSHKTKNDFEIGNNDQAVEMAESRVPSAENIGTAVLTSPSEISIARKLVKTILDQGYLSPFPLSIRPVLWDYAGALQLYPLPSALVLMDPEMSAFTVTYEGCHVMNPGALLPYDRKAVVQWIEYDIKSRRGKLKDARI